MTPPARVPDLAAVVRALSDAGVQFVVVGEPAAGEPVHLVVSRHPTNLDALGRSLDRLGAALRREERQPARDGEGSAGPRRAVDPSGTIAVRTLAGDVDLMFGGAGSSLYAAANARAQQREVGEVRVQWIERLPAIVHVPRPTGRMLGRRLLSLADGLAQLTSRRDERAVPEGPMDQRETPPG